MRFHRTKATTLIQVIASDIQSLLINKVCNNFFSIAFEETTDVSTTKIMVTMLRYFDEACGSVNTILYKIDEVPITDAETLFNVLDSNLTNDLLSYEKIVSVSTEGPNVMIGLRNSVTSRLIEKQPAIFSLHCPCHVSALISSYAVKKLPKDISNLCAIFFIILVCHPDKSSCLLSFKNLLSVNHTSCYVLPKLGG